MLGRIRAGKVRQGRSVESFVQRNMAAGWFFCGPFKASLLKDGGVSPFPWRKEGRRISTLFLHPAWPGSLRAGCCLPLAWEGIRRGHRLWHRPPPACLPHGCPRVPPGRLDCDWRWRWGTGLAFLFLLIIKEL